MIETGPLRHFATRIPPQWSPDGSRLLVESGQKTLVIDEELSTLSAVGPSDEWVAYGRWSPDGESVTYSYFDPHPGQEQPHWGVFRSSAEGGEETMLSSTGWQALPSPDGEQVAYKLVKKEVPTQLAVMNEDGTEETPLLEGRFSDTVWAPDGESLIFSQLVEGAYSLKELELSTGEVSTLVDEGRWNVSPAVSPDGNSVVYESVDFVRERVDLKKVDLETGEISTFFNGTIRQRDAAWSPDGTKVAFTAETEEGDHDIYIADADGNEVQKFTSLRGYEHAPSWSPDGQSLAFYRYDWEAPAGKQRWLHTYPVDGSPEERKERLLG